MSIIAEIVLILAAFITIWAAEENEAGVAATIILVVTLLALQVFGHVHVFTFIATHIIQSLVLFLCYLAIGIGWSFAKWYLYLIDKRDSLLSCNRDSQWIVANIPKAVESKALITTWMIYWPWSMLWALLHDFIKHVFDVLFEWVKKTYDNMAESVFKDIINKAKSGEK